MPNEIEIVSDPEEADADVMVCTRITSPLVFPDNVIDLCSGCGEAIQHRPHVPTVREKLCLECFGPRGEQERARNNLRVVISEKTAREVRDYFRKKNAN